jgi:hypothetical protein
VRVRDLTAADLELALVLNNAAVPALNALDAAELARLHSSAAHALGAVGPDGELAGFCLTLAPGVAYDSLNYRWFSARYDSFTYLDRIVVAPPHRNSGLGASLYAELERRIAGNPRWLLCEVNVKPRNEGSLRFHQRIGFVEVGQQDTEGGAKRVSLLAKDLARPPRAG